MTRFDLGIRLWNGPGAPQGPALVSAAVDGTSLVATFNRALKATNLPAGSAFAVTADGASRTVSGVAVSGSTLTLTLSAGVGFGTAVLLSYTDPTAGDDTTALQGASDDIDVASFGPAAVTNNTAPGPVAFGYNGDAGYTTGTMFEYVVPAGVTSITGKCWGSAPGTTAALGIPSSNGGEIIGTFATVPGETLIIIVGDQSGGRDITKGGGGTQGINGGAADAQHGGGFSAIIRKKFTGLGGGQITIPLSGNPGPVLLVAGGAGGTAGGGGQGGRGSGGAPGESGVSGTGSGGSPAGGAGGNTGGTAWLGANGGGGGASNSGAGGAGGGGRFGGLGGTGNVTDSYGGGGGGGSGYFDATEVSGVTATLGNSGDAQRSGAGQGFSNASLNTRGRVVLVLA